MLEPLNISVIFTFKLLHCSTGLPHTQGTQGIQGNSGNFQVEKNLREIQEILIYFLTQGNSEILIFSKEFREVLRF